MRLLILSHTPHYVKGGITVGWGATVREIDQLARLFNKVVHLAPCYPGEAPGSSLAYTRENIRFVPVRPAGGDKVGDKLGILGRIPGWLRAMKEEMQRADAMHIRCPAGISLVGLLAARWWGRGKPLWVKYAGNWAPYPGQPGSYRLQRWLITRKAFPGVVTVNGHWKDQNERLVSFYNPSFTRAEYQHAQAIGVRKPMASPVKLLFVGRLSKAKGVDRVLKIAGQLQETGLDFDLTLVGDSEARPEFEAFVAEEGLKSRVHFAGWQPMDDLAMFYREAHLLVFPSTSEGWPKVLSEAMAYGVVPIASAVGSIPEILDQTGAGLALPQEDTGAYVDAILQYTQDINRWKQASLNGTRAGAQFTYEHYLQDVQALFRRHWQIELTDEQT